MAQQKKRSGKNQQKSGLALALWALAALILLVIFVVNQKKIISNLKSTDFFDQVFGKTPAFVENSETEEIVDQEIDKNDVQPESSVVSISVNPTQTTSSVTAQNEAAREQEAQATEAKNVQQETQPVTETAVKNSYEPEDFKFSGTVYLVGDSTVCEYDKNTNDSLNRYGWGMKLGGQFNNVQVTNLALSGRSSRSFLVCSMTDSALRYIPSRTYLSGISSPSSSAVL